jgi:hypothetical protein
VNSFPSRKEIVARRDQNMHYQADGTTARTGLRTTANDCDPSCCRLMYARDSGSMIGGSRREGCL